MMDNDDPFAVVAAEQISSPVKARLRVAQTRAERREAKRVSDKEILHKAWRIWHDRQLKRLNIGKHRREVAKVAVFLETMSLQSGRDLVALIDKGPWRDVDADSKFLLLGLISERLMYLRIAEGWAPFDDSIPYVDEPSAFELIRKILQT